MQMRRLILLFLVILGFSAQAQEFAATVNRKEVPLNSYVQVSFTLQNARPGDMRYPDFKGFNVLSGPNTSSQMQFVNGKVSQSSSITFQLQPTKLGNLTIGAATVTVDGKTLKTTPITIKATKATANSSQNNEGTSMEDVNKQLKDEVFVRAFVNKRKAFIGEPVTLTYKLYTRVDMGQTVPKESPSYPGFWSEELKMDSQAKAETFEGKQYRTVIIKQNLLFPQKSGKLRIDPWQLKSNITLRLSPGRRSGSLFDEFFGRRRDVIYEFQSNPVTIEVTPLPLEGRPASFEGAVGDFSLDASLDKSEIETGEAVTFKMKVSGKGNLRMLKEPNLDFPPDFDKYDPKVSDKISKSAAGLRGSKSYDYFLVSRNPGEYKFPVYEFAYFNPKTAKYKVLRSPEYTLKVEGEPQAQGIVAPNIAKEDVELIGEDIRFAHSNVKLSRVGDSFIRSTPFWLVYVLPFLLFGALLVFRNNQLKAKSNVAFSRSKKAQKMAKKRLAQAEQFRQSEDKKAFFQEISRALYGYIADKLNLGLSALSKDNIQGKLLERQVPEEHVGRLMDILNDCEMAVFAPSAVEGKMESTFNAAMTLILDMESPLRETQSPA